MDESDREQAAEEEEEEDEGGEDDLDDDDSEDEDLPSLSRSESSGDRYSRRRRARSTAR
jgi:hypothetical protein